MSNQQHIAVVCNYELKPDRIGGMDRFFKAYNEEVLNRGYKISWYFSGNERIEFYTGFDLYLANKKSVENLLLDHLDSGRSYEIVVTHFLALCTPFYKNIKTRTRAYIIAVDHNPRPLHGFPLKKRLKNKFKGKIYGPYIDRFVGVSQYTVDHILKDYGNKLQQKTSLVYNGIDCNLYVQRRQEQFGKFIVASHLRASKGIQDLLEAVSLLPEENRKHIKIDIYGEGPMEEELKEMVKNRNLEENIWFCGSSSQLPKLFQNYSYLLQPTYMECFSLSILESLAANVPVITTPVGGNLEIIENNVNGYIFEAKNSRQLSEILRDILQKDDGIEKNVSSLIETTYNLQQMLSNHLKLLPCT